MFIGLKFNYNIHLKTIKSILTTVCIGSNGSFTSLINNFLRSLITLFNTFIYLISIFFLFHREYFPYVCFASSDLLGLSSSFFFELFPKIVHRQCQFDIRNEIFSFFSSPHFSFVFFRIAVYWTCWDNEMKNVYSKEMVTFILFRRRYDRLPVRAI